MPSNRIVSASARIFCSRVLGSEKSRHQAPAVEDAIRAARAAGKGQLAIARDLGVGVSTVRRVLGVGAGT
jgi:DNA invertase Pin-like site-specific DNA recombinase